jgi:hypothetical protein
MTKAKVAKPVVIPTKSPGLIGIFGPFVGTIISDPGSTFGKALKKR